MVGDQIIVILRVDQKARADDIRLSAASGRERFLCHKLAIDKGKLAAALQCRENLRRIGVGGTFVLAILATYLIEHPAARRIMAWQPKQKPHQNTKREPLISLEVIEPDPEAEEPLAEEPLTAQPQKPNSEEQDEK